MSAREDAGHPKISPDPRVSLANERTFLAWIRTCLGLITAGLVTAQVLAGDQRLSGPRLMGAGLIVAGALIAVLSLRSWKRNEQRIVSGEALQPSRLPGLLTALMALAAAVATAVALWGPKLI